MSGHGAGFDETTHRCAVPGQSPTLEEGGVGVGVEVDQCDLAETMDPGHSECVGPGDGVVAAKDDGYLARSRDVGDNIGDSLNRLLHLSGYHVDVSDVDHTEDPTRVEPGG